MRARVISLNDGILVLRLCEPGTLKEDEFVDIKKQTRSASANAYFHVLVGKLADALRISKIRCKNVMLARYGQRMTHFGAPVRIAVDDAIDMMEREDIHCTAVGYEDDKTVYEIIEPSHRYDTREMSILIDGVVEECKAQGIETLTEEELLRDFGIGKA